MALGSKKLDYYGRGSSTHLSKGALADERVNLVAVKEPLAVADDVIMVVVVKAFVVQLALFLVALILALGLLRTPLLLGIVHLKTTKSKQNRDD